MLFSIIWLDWFEDEEICIYKQMLVIVSVVQLNVKLALTATRYKSIPNLKKRIFRSKKVSDFYWYFYVTRNIFQSCFLELLGSVIIAPEK